MTLPHADLLDQLEAAECGSRELDHAIRRISAHPDTLMDYTTSIDAALTLVPEGFSWEVRRSGFGSPAQARIWNPSRSPPAFDPGNDWRATNESGCAPIALVIAALRAQGTAGRDEKESGN